MCQQGNHKGCPYILCTISQGVARNGLKHFFLPMKYKNENIVALGLMHCAIKSGNTVSVGSWREYPACRHGAKQEQTRL
jgi:hypothetical protein